MIKTYFSLIAATFIMVTACTTDSLGDSKYKAAIARAHEDHLLASRECDKFAGDAKSLCRTEANVTQSRTVAAAKAENLGTAAALTQAERDNVNADWELAKEKCNTFGGDTKTECLAKARAARDASLKEIDANEAKQDAEWKAAYAQCEELGGTYRSTCFAEARAKFGR